MAERASQLIEIPSSRKLPEGVVKTDLGRLSRIATQTAQGDLTRTLALGEQQVASLNTNPFFDKIGRDSLNDSRGCCLAKQGDVAILRTPHRLPVAAKARK